MLQLEGNVSMVVPDRLSPGWSDLQRGGRAGTSIWWRGKKEIGASRKKKKKPSNQQPTHRWGKRSQIQFGNARMGKLLRWLKFFVCLFVFLVSYDLLLTSSFILKSLEAAVKTHNSPSKPSSVPNFFCRINLSATRHHRRYRQMFKRCKLTLRMCASVFFLFFFFY